MTGLTRRDFFAGIGFLALNLPGTNWGTTNEDGSRTTPKYGIEYGQYAFKMADWLIKASGRPDCPIVSVPSNFTIENNNDEGPQPPDEPTSPNPDGTDPPPAAPSSASIVIEMEMLAA